MSMNLSRWFTILPMLVLLGPGCAPATVPAPPPVTSGPVAPIARPDSNCKHPYWPLTASYRAHYWSTTDDGQQVTYDLTVSSIDVAKAELVTTVERASDVTSKTIFCQPDGSLTSDRLLDFERAASPTLQRAKIDVTSVDGPVLPPADKLSVLGFEWTRQADISIRNPDPAFRKLGLSVIPGRLVARYVVQGEENVETILGTFKATKIKVTEKISVSLRGRPEISPFGVVTHYEWWAKDTGLVKVEIPATSGLSGGRTVLKELER